MNNETETIEQTPVGHLYGKVIGIFKLQTQLEAFITQLGTTVVGDVESLSGLNGTKQLESWKESFSQYFFGEMEIKMLQLYLDAAAVDLIVFAVEVESDLANETAEIAKANGAVNVVYFGNSVVTNY